MKVLIACEFSGIVRDAFAQRGHDAWSCDLLPTEKPGNHIQGDALEAIKGDWDLLIAHPPCTYLSHAGNAYLNQPGRREKIKEGFEFFMAFINAPIERICVENPQGFVSSMYRPPDQTINPFQFGHPERKRTCLWLKNLPKLADTSIEFPQHPVVIQANGKRRYFTDTQSSAGGQDALG